VNRTRVVILFLLLLLPLFDNKAQTLPSACTESWVRYAATPDSLLQILYASSPDTDLKYSEFRWFVLGDYLELRYSGIGNDTLDIHWGRNPGRYRLGISEISASGCIGDTLWTTVDVNGAVVDLGPDQTLCAGDTFSFYADIGFASYRWNNGIAGTSNYFSDTARQTDTISVEAVSADRCASSDTAIVTVHPLPVITFTADGKDTSRQITICSDQQITIGAGAQEPGSYYEWSTNSSFPEITVHGYDNYNTISVKITSIDNCVSEDSVELVPCVQFIPSGFTPNDDAINETWEITYLKYYPNATVDVYDRWGSLVYHSDNGYKTPWDGKVNGVKLPTDSYIYIIKLNSNTKPIVGHVTIVR
jgi:gliding motility-associated-like protein